jgi:leucyl-tRNA synthetase
MDPHNDTALASKEALDYWGQVDWYNGGMEHTTLHLLYSRFWNHFLYDIGAIPHAAPYAKRTSHGMILGQNPTYVENFATQEEKDEALRSTAARPCARRQDVQISGQRGQSRRRDQGVRGRHHAPVHHVHRRL